MYKYYKSNKKKNALDCTVRALMVTEGWDWYKAYDFLCDCGKIVMDMPSSMSALKEAAKRLGYKKAAIKIEKGSKRPTPASITKEFNSTMILSLAGHVVGCKNGNYYDTWDCGNKSVYTYFYKS